MTKEKKKMNIRPIAPNDDPILYDLIREILEEEGLNLPGSAIMIKVLSTSHPIIRHTSRPLILSSLTKTKKSLEAMVLLHFQQEFANSKNFIWIKNIVGRACLKYYLKK